jgi:DNA repair protein RecN (Recombination protein N)
MVALAEEGAELAREVRVHAEAAQPDPDRLEAVRARLRLLADLQRKYGDDEAEILAFLVTARTRLEALAGTQDERAGLEAEAEDLRRRLDELARSVSAGRQRGAPELSEGLERELGELGMEGASIRVALEPLEEPGANGAERVELRFSAVAGGDPLPLARTGSGGELSRVMLACRSVLADLDEIPTLVFDEVDAGIGGRAGVAVGRRLARLAGTRQVLVVTHLPQIASFADRHIRVEKREGTATVGVLEDADRVAELSRMLSGLPGSERAASHAEELLSEASKDKASVR